ncbi:MAG: toxin HipA [Bacteroidetes bacterium RIFCSPLOWO2_12_FULL_31_6]|nr:MAG: toxin HipA [Bacteroidetes bacterium RIFCSPLOWO2_12_FULL_31_6]
MNKTKNKRDIYVYGNWAGINSPLLIGVLYAELLRGKEIFSFEYDEEWLHSKYVQQLDPDLQLYAGLHYLNGDNKSNFGLFLDSSPDRWGRLLMKRREAATARIEKRSEKNLFETDFLLGVYDEHRMGALRFKLEQEGPFLNNNKELASPPWTSIRELEQISLRLESEDIINDPDYLKWLDMLIVPGSSLGGARPKASVLDNENNLWIAKFPSKNDDTDIGAWEIVTHQLAIEAGVYMAEAQAKKFTSKHHTFLTKRFDRTNHRERIHFASAMTLLGYTDGSDYTDGVSYLELVEFISNYGANVNKDLEQLWRRIVFSICVSNTDDHLRNHGFILTDNGWILSPAYDINPVETGTGLKLNISENDNALALELAMEVYPYFRLDKKKADSIIQEVQSAVKDWRKIATKYGISKAEQELKARAFLQSDK